MTMKTDVVMARFIIKIPPNKCLHIINTRFPHLEIKILALTPLSRTIGICLLQLGKRGIHSKMNEILDILADYEYEVLGDHDDIIIISVKMSDPWIMRIFIRYQVLIQYPLKIMEGGIEFKLIATRNKMDRILKALESQRVKTKIKDIGRYKPQKLLTPRQEEILKVAYESGYYEIPRKISLSQLAARIGISASALSENLRRIERRFAAEYLGRY